MLYRSIRGIWFGGQTTVVRGPFVLFFCRSRRVGWLAGTRVDGVVRTFGRRIIYGCPAAGFRCSRVPGDGVSGGRGSIANLGKTGYFTWISGHTRDRPRPRTQPRRASTKRMIPTHSKKLRAWLNPPTRSRMIAITPAITKSVFIELRIPSINCVYSGRRPLVPHNGAPPMPTGTDRRNSSPYRFSTPRKQVQTEPILQGSTSTAS